MDITSFVSKEQWLSIKNCVESRSVFSHKSEANGGGNRITLRLDSHFVDAKTAKNIWHGNDYLVGFNVEYRGKAGIGGFGYCIDLFDKLQTWEDFKAWIDSSLKRFEGYEIEEYGQMCLF